MKPQNLINLLIDAEGWIVQIEGEWGLGRSFEQLLGLGDEDALMLQEAREELRNLLDSL